jgi:hypothetical protein
VRTQSGWSPKAGRARSPLERSRAAPRSRLGGRRRFAPRTRATQRRARLHATRPSPMMSSSASGDPGSPGLSRSRNAEPICIWTPAATGSAAAPRRGWAVVAIGLVSEPPCLARPTRWSYHNGSHGPAQRSPHRQGEPEDRRASSDGPSTSKPCPPLHGGHRHQYDEEARECPPRRPDDDQPDGKFRIVASPHPFWNRISPQKSVSLPNRTALTAERIQAQRISEASSRDPEPSITRKPHVRRE